MVPVLAQLGATYGRCPPNSGKLIFSYCHMHGYKIPKFHHRYMYLPDAWCMAAVSQSTVISDIALTVDNPLHCVLAGSSGTGEESGLVLKTQQLASAVWRIW